MGGWIQRKIPMKIKILKYVAEQGLVCVSDVERHLGMKRKTNSIRVTMRQLGLRCLRFGVIKYGVWFVEDRKLFKLLKSYYPNMRDMKPGCWFPYKVYHCLGMNEIRYLMENTKAYRIFNWQSEYVLRAMPMLIRAGFGKVKFPDATFQRRLSDTDIGTYFLEYERSSKYKVRYERIFKFYAKRPDTGRQNVIYVCEDGGIVQKLKDMETDMARRGLIQKDRHFRFLTIDQIRQTYQEQGGENHEDT